MPSVQQDPVACAQRSHAADSARATRLPRLKQLAIMQDNLLKDSQKPDLDPLKRAQVARAWKELEALRQELLGRGKPRPITAKNDPDARPKRKAQPLAEPID